MERAITEILYLVSIGKDLEVALYTVLSKYSMESNDHALVVREDSWRDDLADYLKRKLVEGRSPKSIKNYQFVITCALETINKPTDQVTTDDIQMYLLYKKNVDGCTDKYIRDLRTKINGFFEWAKRMDIIKVNPVDGVAQVKVRKKHVNGFTEEELERMRVACDKGRNAKRDRAMLELLDSSGMRCNELIQLDIADIDLDAREGIIHHGKGDKERVFFFSKVAAMYLKEYLKTYDGLDGALFVSSKSHRRFKNDSSVEIIVKKWGEDAGILNAHPHRFRHTFITRCINKGISIQDTKLMVGHECINTTANYYDESREKVKAEHSRLCA